MLDTAFLLAMWWNPLLLATQGLYVPAFLLWFSLTARKNPEPEFVPYFQILLGLLACVVLQEVGRMLVAHTIQHRSDRLNDGIHSLDIFPSDPHRHLALCLARPLIGLAIVGLMTPFTGNGSGFHEGRAVLEIQLITVALQLLPVWSDTRDSLWRGFLLFRRDLAEAMKLTANAGLILAVVLSLYGSLAGSILPWLMAVFVWRGALRETERAHYWAHLRNIFCRDCMVVDGPVSAVIAPLVRAYEMEHRVPGVFPVVQEGSVVGVHDTKIMRDVPSGRHSQQPVSLAIRSNYKVVQADESVAALVGRPGFISKEAVIVLDGKMVTGIIPAWQLVQTFLSIPNRRWFGLLPPAPAVRPAG